MAERVARLVGVEQWRAWPGQNGPTLRITGWPHPELAEYTDIAGAQAVLHAAWARLTGQQRPDYNPSDMPGWAWEHYEAFAPDE